MTFTQIDYQVGSGSMTSFRLWGCAECGALVWNQKIHEWWHRNYVHRDDAKPWWRRRRNVR